MPSLPRHDLFRLWLLTATMTVGLAMTPLSAAAGQGGQPDDQQRESQPTQDLLWRAVTGDDAAEGAPRERLFSLQALQIGADESSAVTSGGAGRFFGYLNNRTALQVEGEADFYGDRREGQFDVGLVQRAQNAQLGLFSNFKYARLDGFDDGGVLAQATATFDYLFPRGRLGIFGTKGLRDQVLVHRREVRRHHLEESLLQVVDQLGLSAQIDIVAGSSWKGTPPICIPPAHCSGRSNGVVASSFAREVSGDVRIAPRQALGSERFPVPRVDDLLGMPDHPPAVGCTVARVGRRRGVSAANAVGKAPVVDRAVQSTLADGEVLAVPAASRQPHFDVDLGIA